MTNKPVVYTDKPTPKRLTSSDAWPTTGTVASFVASAKSGLGLGAPSDWTLKACQACGQDPYWKLDRSQRYAEAGGTSFYLFCEHSTARAYLEFMSPKEANR